MASVAASIRRTPRLPLVTSLLAACLAALLALVLLAQSWQRVAGARLGPSGSAQLKQPLSALPDPLAALASARIGGGERSFWVFRQGDSLLSRGGGIGARYTSSQTQLQLASGSVGMRLAGIARGARWLRVAPARPSARANEVLYRRGAISEYYRNGPFGLEQGFLVRKAPAGAGSAPLTIDLALSGPLRPRQQGSQLLFRNGTGAIALRYGQLQARDATGRSLRAAIRLHGHTVALRIDDRAARYPLTIDPFFQQGSKLTGAEEAGAGAFGRTVALSADGNTALIGGPKDNAEAGAAWIFTRSGSTWSQQGSKLTGAEESGKGRFGSAVALSADGNTAVIGGGGDNGEVGAAWIFTRSESTWSQQGPKLTGSGESGKGHFGFRVAIAGNGTTALIGAPLDSSGAGAAWVFTLGESTWSQQAELTGSGESGKGEFGLGVALSFDGNTALVGGGSDNAEAGAGWVFTRSESAWSQQGAKLTGSGEVGAGHFGFSVALSEDGNTALIGGGSDNGEIGAAWVFTRSESVWSQQGSKLSGSGETGKAHFGAAVALSASGDTALIGGLADSAETGAAWVFTRSESTWSQLGAKLAGSGESGKGTFGYAAALSADGNTALLGGPGDGGEAGAAWVFLNGPPPPPTVVTGSASSVLPETATLNATVNPNGEAVSDCHFEYGTTIAYGSSAPCKALPGSGKAPVTVSAEVASLSPNTTYHFQIVATNPGGTTSGSDQTFRTGEAPEFGRCAKVLGEKQGSTVVYHGGFTTSACIEQSATKSGKFEWYPGAVKPSFTTKLKEGVVTLETVKKVAVTCKGETGAGQISGPREVSGVTLQFSGCESSGQKCTTPGAGEGAIETKQLEGALGWESRPKKLVALDLFPPGKSGPFMEYRCGELESPLTTVQGSLLVPMTHNKMQLTATLKYKATAGKQKPERFEGMPADVLTALRGEATEQLGVTAVLAQTGEEALEVNAAV